MEIFLCEEIFSELNELVKKSYEFAITETERGEILKWFSELNGIMEDQTPANLITRMTNLGQPLTCSREHHLAYLLVKITKFSFNLDRSSVVWLPWKDYQKNNTVE